ncbi:MAG: PAS domain-containing protein [Candidatus Latescibacteria bacterium]|nr:PAS domain-containing protein [bacterium]MBD3424614.1 PAS domain-containing protein [Candidatus Latescibacterota bacterium]
MRRKRIIWHILPYHFLIVIIALVAVSWYASTTVRQFFIEETKRGMEERARLLRQYIIYDKGVSLEDIETVDALCDTIGAISGMRVTLILPSGKVAGDSENDPATMVNHADRPEIISAFRGKTGNSIRYSETLKRNQLYVAIPVIVEGKLIAVIRTSVHLVSLEESLGWMTTRIFWAGLLIACLALIVGGIISRKITGPLEAIRKGAERFAGDDLDYRLPQQGLLETDTLSEVMNDMAQRLAVRIENTRRQRMEQEAIFSSMNEGLLVVDNDEKVIRMNPLAREIFETGTLDVIGKSIQEVVRNYEVEQLAGKLISGEKTEEIELKLSEDKYYSISGAPLYDREGKNQGAVIMLRDIARLRKLENIRRDFVANVSHELRTPITTIKGFAETLLDEGGNNPEKLERFLKIISRHADRMNFIIEDLLTLSRLQQTQSGEERFELLNIQDVLDETLDFCLASGEENDIEIITEFPEDLQIKAVPVLISQAISNLVDNAIKNSDPGSRVKIIVTEEEDSVYIDVIDRGRGIGEKHLPRIFERFYRVDRARSRREGGTGLGLAIVKHIAQVHGGSVEVESELGKGSRFRIIIPAD